MSLDLITIQSNRKAGCVPNFLELPGEIRNTIYGLCLQDLTKNSVIEYYSAATSGPQTLESYHALASTCREIREEAISYLMKKHTIQVSLRHVPAFLNSLLARLLLTRRPNGNTTSAKININMFSPSTSPSTSDVDIAPLIQCIATRPNVQLCFTGFIVANGKPAVDGAAIPHLQHMFAAERRPAWGIALKQGLVSIILHEQFRSCQMLFKLQLVVRNDADLPGADELGILDASEHDGDGSRGHGERVSRVEDVGGGVWVRITGDSVVLDGGWVGTEIKMYKAVCGSEGGLVEGRSAWWWDGV